MLFGRVGCLTDLGAFLSDVLGCVGGGIGGLGFLHIGDIGAPVSLRSCF